MSTCWNCPTDAETCRRLASVWPQATSWWHSMANVAKDKNRNRREGIVWESMSILANIIWFFANIGVGRYMWAEFKQAIAMGRQFPEVPQWPGAGGPEAEVGIWRLIRSCFSQAPTVRTPLRTGIELGDPGTRTSAAETFLGFGLRGPAVWVALLRVEWFDRNRPHDGLSSRSRRKLAICMELNRLAGRLKLRIIVL